LSQREGFTLGGFPVTFGSLAIGALFSLPTDTQGIVWEKTEQINHVLIGACPTCQEKGTNAVSGGFSSHFCPQVEVIEK